MKLTDRDSFNNLVNQCRAAFEDLESGDRWVISIGVSEDSIAKGVEQIAEKISAGVDGWEIPAEIRLVGSGGWAWADPFLTVCGPNHPLILYGPLQVEDVEPLLHSFAKGEVYQDRSVGVIGESEFAGVAPLTDHPYFNNQRRLLSEHWGRIDPTSIDDYLAVDGYQAWVKALTEMTPDEVIDEVKASGIRGRGGAGFPAGIKWEGGRRAASEPKYMACNSHEGEPNVYKDRRLIESNPHQVLEGIMIGCYAIGAERGYNYIGGEHVMAVDRFRKAVEQAYDYGLLGDNILGTGVNCHIRVRAGGGAYICGEGSALMYSVMGERGQPRTKPPRSVEEGLWRRPTVLNNTETLAPVPAIIRNGGEWYAGIGTERSSGTKLITMQGPLARLGVVEIEMGISLKELIFDMYGGMAEGAAFKGVQTGGVSAVALTKDQLDVAVDFDDLQEFGAMLGSGGFIVFDESVNAVEFGRYLMDFNRWESCAKCTPCRLGNKALVEVVDRILNGNGRPSDLELIKHTSKHVMDLSLCGLGQVAPVPLLGMMQAYPLDFEAYLQEEDVSRETQIPVGVAAAK